MRALLDETLVDTALDRAVFMAHSEALKLDRWFDLFRVNDLYNLLTGTDDAAEWGRRFEDYKAAAARFDLKWGA